ncbi:MAG: MFS transporter [Puniceicoccales bacterium]|jgi:phosphoglycerate transporter family protein|nr:MFS transporter [Puniceicoccales bacterium]
MSATGRKEKVADEFVDKQYKYWRFRIIYSLIIGYATFYLVRQNFQVATPKMLHEFGYTNADIGWVFTAFSIIYGLGKFINGAICDRTNARWFMTIGLIGSALCSIFIGVANSLWVFILCYAANGIFQSAGWPPISRLMTQWYSPHELGTKWGIVNASHQLGSIVILIYGSKILIHFGWRYVFFIPAAVAILLAFFLFERLRDNPQSLGLPSIAEKENLVEEAKYSSDENATFREMFMEHILPNKSLWYVCMANVFVYIVRMGFFNWAPTFLQRAKGLGVMQAAYSNVAFELMGAVGGFIAGWASDKIFGGRRNCTSFYFMVALIVALLLYWKIPSNSPLVNTTFLFVIGFFIYGPQTLVGVSGAEFGSRRAAATGAGLTGTFGYLGSAISGYGVGKIADKWGWDTAFLFFVVCACFGTFFFLLNWNKTSQRQKSKA